jgi:Na+-driven multidrug efflux pump
MAFVGTEMGKGSIKNAKSYVKMGIFIFFIACLIYSTVVWVLKK